MKRVLAEERMDDPALDPATYQAVLADLSRMNRYTLAARPTLDFIDRARGARSTFRLLDVGFGQGDMLRTIARYARRKNLDVDLVGVDLNPSSLLPATAATPKTMPIRYQIGDYRDVKGPFDMIVSSLVTHHMDEEERIDFLGHMDETARLGWFVNDLHRHPLAYRAYPLLARLTGVHDIVRHDGQVSIGRAFTREDWRAMLARTHIRGATIKRYFPFRLCVERVR